MREYGLRPQAMNGSRVTTVAYHGMTMEWQIEEIKTKNDASGVA
jgi:hypothetical protein